MLEELRTLTNFADAGESLLRLIVCGDLSLEETLSQPSLDAFNQRIGIQTTLQPLTRDESAEYLSRRLTLAGTNVTDLLTADALAAICEASDGSPRCLNQLADHSLLLGYLASQKPVPHQTVREALDDLKQLPLNWNELLTRPTPLAESPLSAPKGAVRGFDDEAAWIVMPDDPLATDESEAELESVELGSVEFGHTEQPRFGDAMEGDAIEIGDLSVATARSILATAVASPVAAPRIEPIKSHATALPSAPEIVDEEVVIDRYAALDAALGRLTRTMLCAPTISRRTDVISTGLAESKPMVADDEDDVSPAFDVVLPEESPAAESPAKMPRPTSRLDPPVKEEASRPLSGRRYELLFSELRRRRIGA